MLLHLYFWCIYHLIRVFTPLQAALHFDRQFNTCTRRPLILSTASPLSRNFERNADLTLALAGLASAPEERDQNRFENRVDRCLRGAGAASAATRGLGCGISTCAAKKSWLSRQLTIYRHQRLPYEDVRGAAPAGRASTSRSLDDEDILNHLTRTKGQ
jgi:hypothetical protein